MLYAQVVFSLAIEGPFDYSVPQEFQKKIKIGSRVWVFLRTKRTVGFVVGLSKKTNIKKVKNIINVIDDVPVVDSNLLALAKRISNYYVSSWGDAIDLVFPEAIRKGRPVDGLVAKEAEGKGQTVYEGVLVHDQVGTRRWQAYLDEIKKQLESGRSALVILPDVHALVGAQELIKNKLNCPVSIMYRKQSGEVKEWVSAKNGEIKVIVGTRSCIFAPLKNLGLIIVDSEEDFVYKQDQTPHYHAREVALSRGELENLKVILGSTMPSMESMYLVKNNKIKYVRLENDKKFPQVKIIDTSELSWLVRKQGAVILKYLQDNIAANLNSGGKTCIFINRKGFATFAACKACQAILKCPRCNINLVYHFKEKNLTCHYCNFKMPPPEICPACNSGYIKYAGAGTEKIESELSRMFPQAKIKRFDTGAEDDFSDADIVIATQAIFKARIHNFSLIGILEIDNSLNRADFHASENTARILFNLAHLTENLVILQTGLMHQHIFKAFEAGDINSFYDTEFKERRSLKFPPYRHLCLVKLRGKNETRVMQSSQTLFDLLKNRNKNRKIEIISVNPGIAKKLRGNFYWQILIKSAEPETVSKFLKICLKDFSHSGIIVTVDMDPI